MFTLCLIGSRKEAFLAVLFLSLTVALLTNLISTQRWKSTFDSKIISPVLCKLENRKEGKKRENTEAAKKKLHEISSTKIRLFFLTEFSSLLMKI